MLKQAVLVFAVAALGGVVLAMHVLRGKFAPWILSVAHALLGATGLVVLLVAVRQGAGGSAAQWALGLFLVAAVGGFYLASVHLKKQLAKKGVVILHAGLAVTAFVLLLVATFGA